MLRWTISQITVICNPKTQDGARGAFHLGKISDWKFRKPSGWNGKAFLPIVEIAAVVAVSFQEIWTLTELTTILNRCYFERYDRKWKEKLRQPVIKAHRQTLEKAEKSPGASRRPKENCANWTGISRSQPAGTEKVEYLGGSSVCSENFRSNHAFHLHSDRSSQKFCLHGKHPGLFFTLYSASSNS